MRPLVLPNSAEPPKGAVHPLIIHERRGHWVRQVRPRVVGWPVQVVETRSTSDLVAALDGSACPLVVIDLAERVRLALDDLDQAVRIAPCALVLVLDPAEHCGVVPIARELGATHVLTGVINPPDVMALLARWVPLARRRAEADGWVKIPLPEPPFWEQLAAAGR
ncbi:MAG: hypothetical protein ABI353_09070 [Isosphaeraceae bacterium]